MNDNDFLEEDNMDMLGIGKSSLKIDNELFDDKSHVVHRLISVKRINLPNGGENWEISDDDKVVFTIPGVRMTKKEKNFLKTREGLETIIREYKNGIKSVAQIKAKLKKCYK